MLFFSQNFHFYNVRYLNNIKIKMKIRRAREKLLEWQKLKSYIILSPIGLGHNTLDWVQK
jgi:hypothetical protein